MGVSPARILYAARASEWALAATDPPTYVVPFTIPGPGVGENVKPVIVVPGETPRSPLRTVLPMLVTVEPPKTAKLSAAPRYRAALLCGRKPANATCAERMKDLLFILNMSCKLWCCRAEGVAC